MDNLRKFEEFRFFSKEEKSNNLLPIKYFVKGKKYLDMPDGYNFDVYVKLPNDKYILIGILQTNSEFYHDDTLTLKPSIAYLNDVIGKLENISYEDYKNIIPFLMKYNNVFKKTNNEYFKDRIKLAENG